MITLQHTLRRLRTLQWSVNYFSACSFIWHTVGVMVVMEWIWYMNIANHEISKDPSRVAPLDKARANNTKLLIHFFNYKTNKQTKTPSNTNCGFCTCFVRGFNHIFPQVIVTLCISFNLNWWIFNLYVFKITWQFSSNLWAHRTLSHSSNEIPTFVHMNT